MIPLSFWLLSILDQTGVFIRATVLDYLRFGNSENSAPANGEQRYKTIETQLGFTPASLLQHVYGNGSASNSGQLQFTNPTVAGSTIVVTFLVSSANASPWTASVSDNNGVGNTYTIDSQTTAARSDGAIIATCTNLGPKALHQVTAALTSAGAGDIVICIYEYANLPRASPTVAATTGSPYAITATRQVTFWAYENGGSGANPITLNSGTADEHDPSGGGTDGFAGRGSGNLSTANGTKQGCQAAYG